MSEITKKIRQDEDERIRRDFPILDGSFTYLDNGATTQKPRCVLEAVDRYYRTMNANPMRGLYKLSLSATEAYEEARETVRSFINAASTEEVIFTRNATESLNLVAYTYGRAFIKEGDEVVITIMEHHSNMIPWQQLCKEKGAKLIYIMPDEDGTITEEMFRSYMNPKVKLVSMTHISNVLGVKNDVKTFARIAHEYGAVFSLDAAQSIPHTKVDVQDLDVDFLSFSGHKIYGPMGIGALYGKKALLEKMPPFLYGGEMIEYVTTEGATWNELPHKFEAGTVNDGGAVGLSAALKYVSSLGFERIEERELHLTHIMMDEMKKLPYIHILGKKDPEDHHGIVTFTIDGVHPHDIAAIFDEHNVDIRAGHHCAQPLMKFCHTPSTVRASIGLYNTEEDVYKFLDALRNIRREMGYKD